MEGPTPRGRAATTATSALVGLIQDAASARQLLDEVLLPHVAPTSLLPQGCVVSRSWLQCRWGGAMQLRRRRCWTSAGEATREKVVVQTRRLSRRTRRWRCWWQRLWPTKTLRSHHRRRLLLLLLHQHTNSRWCCPDRARSGSASSCVRRRGSCARRSTWPSTRPSRPRSSSPTTLRATCGPPTRSARWYSSFFVLLRSSLFVLCFVLSSTHSR